MGRRLGPRSALNLDDPLSVGDRTGEFVVFYNQQPPGVAGIFFSFSQRTID